MTAKKFISRLPCRQRAGDARDQHVELREHVVRAGHAAALRRQLDAMPPARCATCLLASAL
jgi:hypothetical protein